MTTPTGAIAASDINIELGRLTNASFSINDSLVRQLAGISSGPISFNNLRGRSLATVDLRNATYSSIELEDLASIGFIMSSDGQFFTESTFNQVYEYNWLISSTNGSQFEVFTSVISGTGVVGTLNQWLNLGTTRAWSTFSGTFQNTVVLRVQLRAVGSTTVLRTADITLFARRINRGEIAV